jgi:lipopolysaccharide transport system permease protein
MASLAYRLRDAFHLIPFLINFGIWFTPVFFTKDILPDKISFIWYINPMASVVELWRWCFFSGWNYDIMFIPTLVCIIPLFVFGLYLYNKSESLFSDFA